MIAYIKGKLIAKGDNYVVLETNNIGYKIFSIPKILETAIGAEIALHTYMQVREDAHLLFGFEHASDLHFFEMLLTVSGVGPKAALAVVSAENTDVIKNAIISQDVGVFIKIGGVGRKTAEKIILELKDKLGAITMPGSAAGGTAARSGSGDLLAALENLGYSGREIREVITRIDPSIPTEEKLRQALKFLSGQ